ncbi:hypothetical protein [Oceanobacillus jordanicus]|uniref:Uncharacterized protein n=1 Tax=Oceanobacillus jordanicus TaxID=2867266 RepID=A0AAW5B5X0_9BACI|nr:hypothetical protein [Oceanobacillus jordanicus]MCG3418949.1 hypothetical protein [Oceanobacillus jordanicus]
MTKQTTTIKAYEFTTPKFAGDVQYEYTYDYEVIDLLLKSIMKLQKSIRKYKNDTVSINLGDYRDSTEPNYVEGYFITARHGVRRSQIDVETQEEVGTIERIHGVEYNVHFMIDKCSGLLLIQEDFNKVFSRKLLHTFLHLHKNLIYPYIEKFNQLNSQHPFVIHKRSSYRLQTLPPIDFMDKLKEFTKIKSAILTLDHTTNKKAVDVSKMLDEELEENEIEEYDMEIKIKNKTGRAMVSVFEKYFESVIEQQKYDSYAIEGELNNGKTKRITPDTITRDFYGKVEYNINGEPSTDDLFNRMIEIIKQENPLIGKGGTPNIIAVGEDADVQGQIQKIISERNQDTGSQEQTN